MSFPPLLRQDSANHSHWGAEFAFVVACIMLLAAIKFPLPLWAVAAGTQGAAVLAGAFKEWRDSKNRAFHTPEWADFWFTVRGGAHVAGPLLLLSLITEKTA